MHVGSWREVEGKAVTDAGAGGVTVRVLMGDNVGAPNFTTRHFEVAPGGHPPFHAHPWEHEVFVLSGKGKVLRKGGETEVGPGSFVYVPPDEEHAFANAGSETFSFLCAIPATKVCEWAERIRKQAEGFTAFKVDIHTAAGIPATRFAGTLDSAQLRRIARAYQNVRDAVGADIDIAVHCHNEFDTPSAIAVAKAVEPINQLFLEDPLYVPFSESWLALKRSTRIPILGGEKVELVRGFRPLLDNQALDIIHPDLAFAGGITGVRKIADYAQLTRTPVALHNVGLREEWAAIHDW